MKRVYIITATVTMISILTGFILQVWFIPHAKYDQLKVGFVCNSDASSAYTDNFVRIASSLKEEFGNKIHLIYRYNIPEDDVLTTLKSLKEKGCRLIFTTSYDYQNAAKNFARDNPDIQICAATADNANTAPVLKNYHSFMGTIYEARYLTGVAAGLKLAQMIHENKVREDTARVGYVGSQETAEVISGYTAFFLGVRSIVPTATMRVRYTGEWLNYETEADITQKLLDEGCVIIAQHTDTAAPAAVCEKKAAAGGNIYYVGYNSNMMDVAPTSTLISCSINWKPYIRGAIRSVLQNRSIEKAQRSHTKGQDCWAGLDQNWVMINNINNVIAVKGTEEELKKIAQKIKAGNLMIFKGDYIGVDPENSSMIYDLRTGYAENRDASAPSFHYILSDVITVENN